jgi:hypothetical protein
MIAQFDFLEGRVIHGRSLINFDLGTTYTTNSRVKMCVSVYFSDGILDGSEYCGWAECADHMRRGSLLDTDLLFDLL